MTVTRLTEQAKGIAVRVVSFPSWELFEQQTQAYRASVLPAGVPVLSIEAAGVFGWEKVITASNKSPFLSHKFISLSSLLTFRVHLRVSAALYSTLSTPTRTLACGPLVPVAQAQPYTTTLA